MILLVTAAVNIGSMYLFSGKGEEAEMYLELTGVRKMYDEDNELKQIDPGGGRGMLLTLLRAFRMRENDPLKSVGRLFKAGCRKHFSGWTGDYFHRAGGTPGIYSLFRVMLCFRT